MDHDRRDHQLLLFDVVHHRAPPARAVDAGGRVAPGFYIGAAIVFGLGVWYFAGAQYGGEFFAGWLTEYSLSIDNLFIFIIIMSKLAVPRQYQQTALLIGIVIALVMRGIFIAVGAAAINQFSWVFYLFGAVPGLTAVNLATRTATTTRSEYDEPRLVRWVAQRTCRSPTTGTASSCSPRRTASGCSRRCSSSCSSLGMTDLLFALDSIPAIYGLTSEPYLVFTANVFALMGLRQLYFLIGDLLKRLVYLSYGLAFLLALHRREADPPRACTRTSCRSSTAASPSSGRPTSRSGCRWSRSSAPWRSPPWPAWLKDSRDRAGRRWRRP